MRCFLGKGGLLVAALTLVACQREPTTAELELIGEVRALRLQLREQAQRPATEAPPRDAVDAALAPLQGALTALANAQRDLSGQQAALAAELQRWTQLVTVGMQQQGSADAQALTQRLTDLEQQIRAQDVRHREVEALLQKALDSTADQLEDFLRRLGRRESIPQDSGEAPPATPEPAPGTRPGGGEASAGERRGATRWLWWGVAALSIFVGWVVLRRARSRTPIAVPPEMRGVPEPPEQARARDEPPGGPDEPEVEELWAAAALLGEAIGRLKQTGAAAVLPSDVGTEVSPPAPEELLGLAPRTEPDPGAAAPHRLPPTASPPDALPARTRTPTRSAPGPERSGPKAVVCHLRAHDASQAADRIRRMLEGDPRVLVAPAPQVAPAGQDLTVTFALLPGLPPGERSRLEQLLRDAVA